MNVIILGAGKVGYHLARQLIHEHVDVTIIEKDPDQVKKINNQLDCIVIEDKGNNIEILKQAGVEKADCFIGVTNSDEVNIICCGLATSISESIITIARVRNIDYSRNAGKNPTVMGIDYIINPEIEAARVITRSIEHGAMSNVMLFDNTDLQMRNLTLHSGSSLIGQTLQGFAELVDTSFLVPILIRDDDYIMPKGNTIFMENDFLYVLASEKSFQVLFNVFGKPKVSLNKVTILGGGKLGCYVADNLGFNQEKTIGFFGHFLRRLTKGRAKQLQIIDRDYQRSKYLKERYPNASIIHADITDESLWEEELMTGYELVISATGNPELNLILAIYAKKNKIPRSIALVQTRAYQHIAEDLGIDVCISINNVLVNTILKLIRKGNIKSIYNISGSPFEVIEFEIHHNSPLCRKQIKNIKLPKDSLVLHISRGDDHIIPRGDLAIEAEDHVVVISHRDSVSKLGSVFEVK